MTLALLTPQVPAQSVPLSVHTLETQKETAISVPIVPFYSQFKDITSPKWQKVGCGVTSLAMIIDYYKPAVSVNTLLKQGIASGAYLQNAGWSYSGLIGIGKKYGLTGTSYDLGTKNNETAFSQLKASLHDGPVIASVHYKFDPKSTIPHLVVINAVVGDIVYYNDPAAKTGGKTISSADFVKGWKRRMIVIRPTAESTEVALAN